MRYRPDLERLATLDAATIDAVWSGVSPPDETLLRDLITHAVDEYLEYDLQADDAQNAADGDGTDVGDDVDFYRQEAAAWRATAMTLRMVLSDIDRADRRERRHRSA